MRQRKENRKLVGRTVMVHPDLTTDPISMQGNVGKVVEDNFDYLLIEFPENIRGRYDHNGVITLLPCKTILDYLLNNFEMLSMTHRKVLVQIAKLQLDAEDSIALSILLMFPQLLEKCTQNCSEIKEQYNVIKKRQNRRGF